MRGLLRVGIVLLMEHQHPVGRGDLVPTNLAVVNFSYGSRSGKHNFFNELGRTV